MKEGENVGIPNTAPSEKTGEGVEHGRSLRRAAYLTAAIGILHAVLFILAFSLSTTTPGFKASDAAITEFYDSDASRRWIVIGLYLMPFAGIAFIWFIVELRMWIAGSSRRENFLLSNIQLITGILYTALFFIAAAAGAAPAASREFSDAPIDPAVARQLPQFAATLLLVFAMRMAAMFVFTTSNIGRSAGILPRWFGLLSLVLGLFLLLSATFNSWLILVFPVWLLMLCVILLVRSRRIPADATLPARPRPVESTPFSGDRSSI